MIQAKPDDSIFEPDDEEGAPPGKSKSPALEFVKALCKVLSLDPFISSEVQVLRRNMLRLVGVGEFSDNAEWTESSATFILPEVIISKSVLWIGVQSASFLNL